MARLRERRWLIPTALVLVGAIVIGVIIARRGPSAPAFVTRPAVLGTVTQTVDVTGTLQPSNETDLDFGTNGHVQAINVQAGQKVPAGTVLATLDPENANAALSQAQQALNAAQAKLAQDSGGPNNTAQATSQSAVNAARSQIGPAQNALNDALANGQASVSGAQIALQTALAAAQGVINSDQQDVVTAQAQLNDSKAADAAAINVAAATLRQTQASTQAAVNAAQASVTTAKAQLAGQQKIDEAAISAAQKNLTADQNKENADAAAACSPSPAPCPASENSSLVSLDKSNVTKDQGTVQQAQAKLQADTLSLEASVNAAQVDVTDARAQQAAQVQAAAQQVAQAQATAAKDADAAQGALNTAIVQLQNAKIAFQNSQQTQSNQIAIAQTNADKATHDAQGTLSEAQTNYQNTLAELAALVNGQIPGTVLQDQAQIVADQTQVRSATDNVAGTQLVAPVDGMVEQVNVANGQAIGSAASSAGALAASAASGQPTAGNNAQGNLTHAIVLTTPQAFQVSGPVSDAQLPLVHVGDQVNVTPAGGGEQLLGHVTGIAPSALITQGVATFTVTAVIDGQNPNVHTGSTAQMSIVVERDVDVLTVPTSAVHTVGSSSYVNVERNGQEVQVPVTVGASDPTRTQIISGLNKGDQVILAEIGAKPPTGGATPGGGGGGGVRPGGGGGGGGGGSGR